jgi:hypothetical protein
MKKLLLLFVSIGLIASLAYANELIQNEVFQSLNSPSKGRSVALTREAPSYTFSATPVSLMTSYYDYMIGGFHNQPLRVIPDTAGGGYFLSYQGQRNAMGPRRVFYAYINSTGEVSSFREISSTNTAEGFPALAIDPVSGKPLYAWQKNIDVDPELEVQFTSDAFITGISGLFNPVQTVFDSPFPVYPPAGGAPSLDNQFIRPSLQIGPSPLAGMRRAYILTRNATTHTMGASENVLISYADFNGSMIEDGTPLAWSTTSIPELDQWNHDADWRSPQLALSVDNLGNLYYAGYHTAVQAGTNAVIMEPDFDVFVCNNYGQGTWSRISEFSHIPSWNPQATPAGNPYFTNSSGIPYPDGELFWGLINSGHLNAVTDNYGRIIIPGIWGLRSASGDYWPEHQVVKSIIYNPAINNFTISEIYPQKDPADNINQAWTPWDIQAPWGVPEYFLQEDETFALQPEATFPFPHWDPTLHGNNMMSHYNNIKISEPNEQGMMVAVWQDSQRAKWANEDGGTDYLPYVQVPEIFISVSANQGDTWSEPIVLNSVETTEFTNIKPMWVYPADKVKFMGMQDENKIGRVGLMFFNDYTWGSNALTPPAHPTNNGGQVMFAELEIIFPEAEYVPTDPFGQPLVLSSSMSLMASVMIDDEPASEGDVLAAFVDVLGEPQMRGKASLISHSGITGCLMQVFTEMNNEGVYFKLWVEDTNEVFDVEESLLSVVNGSVGSLSDPFILHAIGSVEQEIELHTGWNMFSLNVHPYDNFILSIFGEHYSAISAIKSKDGVHLPGNPFSTLHLLEDGEGYYANMTAPASLVVRGYPIPITDTIHLNPGWNLKAYYPQVQMPTYHATAGISSQLIQLKGEEGLYEPGNPFSSLNILKPGESYWFNVSGHTDLVYPEGISRDAAQYTNQSLPHSPVLKSNSQSVLLGFSSLASPGDLISAWVGDELRGITLVKEASGQLAALLQIFTDTDNEQVTFKLETAKQTMILGPGISTNPGSIVGDYATGDYHKFIEDYTVVPELITALSGAYPNPFKTSAEINLSVGKDAGNLEVGIYNLRGQKIRTLLSGEQPSGNLNLIWDGMDAKGKQMPSGVYFCRMQNGRSLQSIKLMLIK